MSRRRGSRWRRGCGFGAGTTEGAVADVAYGGPICGRSFSLSLSGFPLHTISIWFLAFSPALLGTVCTTRRMDWFGVLSISATSGACT